jgi:membrane-anchored mycosin MYCP
MDGIPNTDPSKPSERIQGTSYAAAYVAGAAALIRAKFPELKAHEVIERLEQFSRHPDGGWNPAVGYGVVDPTAALTGVTPPPLASANPASPLTEPHALTPQQSLGVVLRYALVAGLALLVIAVVAVLFTVLLLRARRKTPS